MTRAERSGGKNSLPNCLSTWHACSRLNTNGSFHGDKSQKGSCSAMCAAAVCDSAAARLPLPSSSIRPNKRGVGTGPAGTPNRCSSAGLRNEGAGHLTKSLQHPERAVTAAKLWQPSGTNCTTPWFCLRTAEDRSLWITANEEQDLAWNRKGKEEKIPSFNWSRTGI